MDRPPTPPAPTLLAKSLHLSFFKPQTTQLSPFLLESPSIPTVHLPTVNLPKFERRTAVRSTKQQQYVSSNLAEKLLGDVGIACGVTFTIVPFLTIVDKAIVQNAAGSHSMMASGLESTKNIIRNPVGYLKSPLFLLMWATYAATYSTANSLKTIMEHREYYAVPEKETTSTTTTSSRNKMVVFLGTSIVNSGASLMKDQAYARMFGSAGAATSVPLVSLGLWATRDFMVVGSSFILPDIMSKYLQDEYNMHKGDAQKLSQLSLPVATQFLAGPIQLLGLDIYNRPLKGLNFGNAVMERARFLAKGFAFVVTARIIRIAPGYGIGGVLNTQYRDSWRDRLIQKEIVKQMDSTTGDAQQLVRLVTSRHSS